MTHQEDAGLYRLTYLSSSPSEMVQLELDAILEVARENNHRHEVTGLLLYHDMQFFQTLEGKRQDVQQVFTRIKADRRHNGCLALESRFVASRLFDGWSMAYKSIGELNASQKQNFVDLTKVRSHFAPDGTNGNANTGILIDSFLSSFRDLSPREQGRGRTSLVSNMPATEMGNPPSSLIVATQSATTAALETVRYRRLVKQAARFLPEHGGW